MQIRLEEWEWDMVDADAAAFDMTRQEMLREMFADGAKIVLEEADDMPVLS